MLYEGRAARLRELTRSLLDRTPLPPELRELYETHSYSCECEHIVGEIRFRSLRAIVQTEQSGPDKGCEFAYGWTWDGEEGRVVGPSCSLTLEEFLKRCCLSARRQAQQDEIRLREKMVHGRYVPSPELRE